jgi:hypothetical protein
MAWLVYVSFITNLRQAAHELPISASACSSDKVTSNSWSK